MSRSKHTAAGENRRFQEEFLIMGWFLSVPDALGKDRILVKSIEDTHPHSLSEPSSRGIPKSDIKSFQSNYKFFASQPKLLT
jgi:hypothetical protein